MIKKKNILMSLLLSMILMMTLTLGPAAVALADGDSSPGFFQEDNFVRITTSDDWNAGELENLTVTPDVGDGALRLKDGETEGTYVSPVISVPAFEYLVASWNADTPPGTYIEVKAKAYVDMHTDVNGGWTGWLSWGKWGTYICRASESTEDENGLAGVDTDTFTIWGEDGETASKIQFMVELHSDDKGVTPTLRQVCATMKNTLEGQGIPVYHPDKGDLPDKVLLDTPSYSQMVREPSIGDVICSPTSMTILLNDRDPKLDLFPEEVALRGYDYDYEGFGNWAFTVASAGAYGFSAYCHYADFDFLRQELAQGRSVEISVSYSQSKISQNPYLENAPTDTGGHLITIVGYETVDGVDYFISNDPAASDDPASAHRHYRADQLDACWDGRLAYAVSGEKEKNAGQYAPSRVPAELKYNDETKAFRLMLGGKYTPLTGRFTNNVYTEGSGVIILITDKDKMSGMPEGIKTTTANRDHHYIKVNRDGDLHIGSGLIEGLNAKSGTAYIIVNNGPTYEASVIFPGAGTEHSKPETSPGKGDEVKRFLFGMAVLAVLAAAYMLYYKKRKEKK